MKIEIKGFDKLQKELGKDLAMDAVKQTVRLNGSELQTKMQEKADFKGHWGYKDGVYRFIIPTGTTKRSIRLDIKDGGLTAEVGATTEYAPYLEHGTRFMNSQPFVKPALDEQAKQFKKDLERLMK